jgi:hypothetical protein
VEVNEVDLGFFLFHIFYVIYTWGFNDQLGVYRLKKSNGKIAKMPILGVEHVAYSNFLTYYSWIRNSLIYFVCSLL